MKAFDTANITINHTHPIFAEGFGAVGVYLRPDRTPLAEIEGLHSVGLQVFSVWEKGFATSAAFFTEAQGSHDAAAACAYAKVLEQPSGTQIFFAVDYDADPDDVLAYFQAVHPAVRAAGYLASVYGSGDVIRFLVGDGYAHSGWLAQSKGWSGYDPDMPGLSVVQGISTTVTGLDVDLDTILDESVLW